jgi:hypothetical protein
MKIKQSHKMMDIYVISDDVYVEVHKFKNYGYIGYNNYKSKNVKGYRGLKQLTQDYLRFKEGDYIYDGNVVKPVDDWKLFKIYIEPNENFIYGNVTDIENIITSIKDIIDSYKK